jgi:hypothetical protein
MICLLHVRKDGGNQGGLGHKGRLTVRLPGGFDGTKAFGSSAAGAVTQAELEPAHPPALRALGSAGEWSDGDGGPRGPCSGVGRSRLLLLLLLLLLARQGCARPPERAGQRGQWWRVRTSYGPPASHWLRSPHQTQCGRARGRGGASLGPASGRRARATDRLGWATWCLAAARHISRAPAGCCGRAWAVRVRLLGCRRPF